ncbi:hypothetical protein X975_20433, partial [Stegodyphus mimosarum]
MSLRVGRKSSLTIRNKDFSHSDLLFWNFSAKLTQSSIVLHTTDHLDFLST